MTIKCICKFNDIYKDGIRDLNKISEVLSKIKYDIIEDHKECDPKIVVVECRLDSEPKELYNNIGRLELEITILTDLDKIKIRKYDYDWDIIMLLDRQTKLDYTYDQGFFHVVRNDGKLDC